jgi:hypothetical protein
MWHPTAFTRNIVSYTPNTTEILQPMTVPQLNKKHGIFYGSRLTTTFTRLASSQPHSQPHILYCKIHFNIIFPSTFFLGATAPSGPGPPHYRGFTITQRHTPHSVGLLWTSDQPVAETSTWKHSQKTDIHGPGGIRTRNRSKRAAADPRLRPRGHWDLFSSIYTCPKQYSSHKNKSTK